MRRLVLKSVIAGAGLLASAYVFAVEDIKWLDSFKDAQDVAKRENKQILANFSGSDWCAWCITLDKEVFNTPEFKKYADKNLILFKADFPRKKVQSAEVKSQNKDLMEKYEITGFPTVLLLDEKGNRIFTTGYHEGGPKPYIKSLKEAIENRLETVD